MISLRRQARAAAFQILFQYDAAFLADGSLAPEGESLARDLVRHFQHFGTPMKSREFAALLVAGTLQHKHSIDEILSEHTNNWTLSRMAAVDRNLLRMGAYEILHLSEVPPQVTLDEVIELAKQFGSAETAPFVNGILDSIAQNPTRQPGLTTLPPSETLLQEAPGN